MMFFLQIYVYNNTQLDADRVSSSLLTGLMELKAADDDRENNFPSVKADAEEKKGDAHHII